MTPPDTILAFRPRDRVDAADLTDWEQAPLLALARHFRHLHGRYGVAVGLTADVRPAGGGWEAVVAPGLAYDPLGRPLTVEVPTPVAVPAGGRPPAGGVSHVLVVRGGPAEPGPLGVPVPAPRPAEVQFVPVGDDPWAVPLAGLRWPAGDDPPRADPAYRATAGREYRRPFIAGGLLQAGITAVRIGDQETFGWQVWVDTRGAGFLQSPPPGKKAWEAERRPVYLVTVGRPTADDAARLQTGTTVLTTSGAELLKKDAGPGPNVFVSRATADGFLLTVRYAAGQAGLAGLEATPLPVSWVGVEVNLAAPVRPPGDVDPDARPEGDVVGPSTEPLSFRWPEFRDGRVLSADALNEVQTTLRNLLRLHNRALHDWGVAQGCGVTPLEAGRGVRVGPGYAVDSEGRELVVPAAVELAVPAGVARPGSTARTWWVTVSYREGPAPRDADPDCRMDNVPLRRLSDAVVRWRDPEADAPADRLRPGLDVILAAVKIDRGAVAEVTAAGRRSAVPPPRPHVYAGRHVVTPEAIEELRKTGGRTITVSTRDGGFVDTPHYLVTVEVDGFDASGRFPNGLPGPAVVLDPTNEGFKVPVPWGVVPSGSGRRATARAAAAGRAALPVLGWTAVVAAVLLLTLLGAYGVGWLARAVENPAVTWQRAAGGAGTVALFVAVWYLARRYFDRRAREQPFAWLRPVAGASWGTWGGRLAVFLLVAGGTVAANTLDQFAPAWHQSLRETQEKAAAKLRGSVPQGTLAGMSGPEWVNTVFGESGDRLLSTAGAFVVGLLPLGWRAASGVLAALPAAGRAVAGGWKKLRERRPPGRRAKGPAEGAPAPTGFVIAWVGIEA